MAPLFNDEIILGVNFSLNAPLPEFLRCYISRWIILGFSYSWKMQKCVFWRDRGHIRSVRSATPPGAENVVAYGAIYLGRSFLKKSATVAFLLMAIKLPLNMFPKIIHFGHEMKKKRWEGIRNIIMEILGGNWRHDANSCLKEWLIWPSIQQKLRKLLSLKIKIQIWCRFRAAGLFTTKMADQNSPRALLYLAA